MWYQYCEFFRPKESAWTSGICCEAQKRENGCRWLKVRGKAGWKEQQQLRNTFPRLPLPFDVPIVPNMTHHVNMDLFLPSENQRALTLACRKHGPHCHSHTSTCMCMWAYLSLVSSEQPLMNKSPLNIPFPHSILQRFWLPPIQASSKGAMWVIY